MPERNPSPNPGIGQEGEGQTGCRKGLLGGIMGGSGEGEGGGSDKRKKMMMMAMMGTCGVKPFSETLRFSMSVSDNARLTF